MGPFGHQDEAIWQGWRRLLSNLIYSGAKVLDVFVEGEAVRRDGRTLTLDEDKVAGELEESVADYYQDV